jgi:hypothetical protein
LLLISVTNPVGVALPLPPPTATVTVNPWVIEILDEDGVTETIGVVGAGVVTVIEADPILLS